MKTQTLLTTVLVKVQEKSILDIFPRSFSNLSQLFSKIRHSLLVTIVALISSILVIDVQGCCSCLKESVESTSIDSEALSEKISQQVKELEYSDEVADDFVRMVNGWKDNKGLPVLAIWKHSINRARTEYEQGLIDKDKLAKVEKCVAKKLIERIRKEIAADEKIFELEDVTKHKKANCLGYTQLFYILGSSLSLSVRPINTIELQDLDPLPVGSSHVSCIVILSDNNTVMLSLVPELFISSRFSLENTFDTNSIYLELKDKNNPLNIYRKIQLLDKNGLIAYVYNNRGCAFSSANEIDKAIDMYTEAIRLNQNFSEAYCNRAVSYLRKDQYERSLSDCNKSLNINPNYPAALKSRADIYCKLDKLEEAICDYELVLKLHPGFAQAHNNRGIAYIKSGQISKAISDYKRALRLNPKSARAHYNYGNACGKSGQYKKAISHYNQAIKLNPKLQQAYTNRGLSYAILGKYEAAKADLLKAVNLNPTSSLVAQINKISDRFKLDLQPH